jgi:DNA polymerase III alpha subunit
MLNDNTIENLIEGVMRHGPEILAKCVSNAEELAQYRETLGREFLNYEVPKSTVDHNNWSIPVGYQTMDIEQWLVENCPTYNYTRLADELALFQKHHMIPVLRAMKYVVDTLRNNNVVWGVGRGSSVASYVLFLIGVHKIDPIKYELPIEEFFKGEQDG